MNIQFGLGSPGMIQCPLCLNLYAQGTYHTCQTFVYPNTYPYYPPQQQHPTAPLSAEEIRKIVKEEIEKAFKDAGFSRVRVLGDSA